MTDLVTRDGGHGATQRVKIKRHANGLYTLRIWDNSGYRFWHRLPDYAAVMNHVREWRAE